MKSGESDVQSHYEHIGYTRVGFFASRCNHKVEVYCSWNPDPQALAVDGFSIRKFRRKLLICFLALLYDRSCGTRN